MTVLFTYLLEELGAESDYDADEATAEITFEFNKKSCVLSIDLSEVAEIMEEAVTDVLLTAIGENGMTVEEFEDQVGRSLEDYVLNELEGLLESLDAQTVQTSYELDGDELYVGDDCFTIELSDKKFELTDYSVDEAMEYFEMFFQDAVFKRQ